jgi:hypothetical protein
MVRRATPRLDKLIARIRRLTKTPGAKSRLAESLGVSRQHLHSWIRGDEPSEPGGETTLHMLEWADAEEAKRKKTRAVLRARPAKARTKQSDETKLRTSRRKT